jgi:hypothetical protein
MVAGLTLVAIAACDDSKDGSKIFDAGGSKAGANGVGGLILQPTAGLGDGATISCSSIWEVCTAPSRRR